MVRQNVMLTDIYRVQAGKIYISGLQAVLRIAIVQQWLDSFSETNSISIIDGCGNGAFSSIWEEYRKAKKYLNENNVKFLSSLTPEITIAKLNNAKYGGNYDVVNRFLYLSSFDVEKSFYSLRCTSQKPLASGLGAVIITSDDNMGEDNIVNYSATEEIFVNNQIPVFKPADIDETLRYAVHAMELSKFSNSVATIYIDTDIIYSYMSVFTDINNINIQIPKKQEIEEIESKNIKKEQSHLFAIKEYIKANSLNNSIFEIAEKQKKRLIIITSGKEFKDTMQAFKDIGITQEDLQNEGIIIYKLAVIWPLADDNLLELLIDTEHILVIDKSSNIISTQVKNLLEQGASYKINKVIDNVKYDKCQTLSPNIIADKIIRIMARWRNIEDFQAKLDLFEDASKRKLNTIVKPRRPYFCAGCSYNIATKLPDNSHALTYGGCAKIATFNQENNLKDSMPPQTAGTLFENMANSEEHLFVNMGDATYLTGGAEAIRNAIISGYKVTYKIIYNAVAAFNGYADITKVLTIDALARQIAEMGIKNIVIITDDIDKYKEDINFPTFVRFEKREDIEYVQDELKIYKSVSVIIYDQQCAIAKKRAIKAGKIKEKNKHLFIYDRLCDGCGDCSAQSNCLAIIPKETEFGRKREINKYICGQDFSCLNGFCPAIVTIDGAKIKSPQIGLNIKEDGGKIILNGKEIEIEIPRPNLPELENELEIAIAGIGRGGVASVANILGLAAHLEDKGVCNLGYIDLNQKNGTVVNYLKIGKKTDNILTAKINLASADIILGLDVITAAEGRILGLLQPSITKIVINSYKNITATFLKNPRWNVKPKIIIEDIAKICGRENLYSINAGEIVKQLFGDMIFNNIFMLGYIWQKGMLPISCGAVMRAIEINDIEVEKNKAAFLWGRLAAFDMRELNEFVNIQDYLATDIDDIIRVRADDLKDYQNKTYADKYQTFMDRILEKEKQIIANTDCLFTSFVAKNLYNLMAYKDEYEIARLYSKKEFLTKIKANYKGNYKIKFNFIPILWPSRNPKTNVPRKEEYHSWVLILFKILAKMRKFRATPFDIFALKKQNREAKKIVKSYKELVIRILENMNNDNYELAIKVIRQTEKITGFGYVRDISIKKSMHAQAEMLKKFEDSLSNSKEQSKDSNIAA